MKPRFLLDEHVWHGLIAVGGRLGLEVIAVQSVLPVGSPDEDVLTYAAQDGRVLVTGNARDFGPLAVDWYVRGQDHSGIIIVAGQTERSLLSRALAVINESYPADYFQNTYRFIQEFAR